MMTFIWLRITSGGNETQNKGAFLFLQQQAEKSLMSIQWNQSPDLWCIIVCAHSWNYEEEMLMSCCWQCQHVCGILNDNDKVYHIPREQACRTMITDWPVCP